MYSKSQFNTLQYYFKWSQLHSNRFQWISKPYSTAANKFTVSPWSSNGLFEILKKTLELEQWTIRNQEFHTNPRKQRGPQRNSERYISNKCKFYNMYSPKPSAWEYSNDDISSEEHFENSKTRTGTYLLLHFCEIFLLHFFEVTKSL